jgi:hypothetical protein
MITVESTEKEIHVTIPRGEMDAAQIEAILRPFCFTSLVAGSAMSQGEAMRLAEESKAGWWEKNQERFAPPQG